MTTPSALATGGGSLSTDECCGTRCTSKGLNWRSTRISNRFLFMNGSTSNTYPSRLNQARISVIEELSVTPKSTPYHFPPDRLCSVTIVLISLIAAISYLFSLLLIFSATWPVILSTKPYMFLVFHVPCDNYSATFSYTSFRTERIMNTGANRFDNPIYTISCVQYIAYIVR